jgi:hypothetical protein
VDTVYRRLRISGLIKPVSNPKWITLLQMLT